MYSINSTKVSVIIPTWNRANTIEKAIMSALAQTASPLEVLVCDDGSSDGTDQIVNAVALKDQRVRWLSAGRGGRPAIPRNRGIRESIGEWLAFLDSDDVWMPDKLDKQLNLAHKLGVQAVCSNAYRLLPGRQTCRTLLSRKKELVTFNDLLEDNPVICSSSIVRKTLFDVVYGFPEDEHLKSMEDYALWLRVASKTPFAFTREPLVVYKDDVASSIRNECCQNPLVQKKYVFENFLQWSAAQHIESDCVENVQKKYQNLLKKLRHRGELDP